MVWLLHQKLINLMLYQDKKLKESKKMAQYKMWIGGKWVDAESGKTYPVFNPATEAEIAQVPLGGKADVDKAVAAARKAFPIWSEKPQAERSQIALKIAALMLENAKELGRIDTLDHGTPIKGCR